MKTKKTSKILSVVLTLAVLVCSLSAVSGFATTAETNLGEAELINNLKTAWGELSKVEDIAKLKTDVLVNQMSGDNTKTPAGVGLTFNANNTFDKSAYDPGYVGGTYYLYGLVFSKKNSTGSDIFFDSNLNSTDNNSFDNAFGDDSLYFTFNPGTVKTAGRMWVILQYNDYGYNNVLYSPVEIATTDSNTDKKIVINDLTFKSAKNDAVIDHSHLSDLLTYTNPANKEVSLYTMKVFFNPGFVTEGSSISGLKTVKKETLPAETEGFTSALEWYNAAKDLDVSGYENAAAFTTALNNLENYLIENDPDFMASELKKSWSKLSKDIDIAKLKTDVLVNQMSGDNTKTLAGVGLTFNENNKFNKSAYDPNYVGGTYYLYGLVFSKKNSTGDNVFFDSNLNSSDNNAFNSAFSDDSLYFTFNPGTVTTPGKMWVLLQYNDYGYENVLYSPVEIKTTDSNTPIRIDINKCTFHSAKNDAVIDHTHLSDLLKYTNPENKEVSLYTMKVFFDPYLVTEGSSISELKTVKKETVPSDTDNELILRKSLRVDTDFYEENVNDFVANKDRLYNYLMTDKTLGNVTEKDDIDIRDLVALKNLGYENDETYKLIADMNKDGYITKDDTTVLRSQILNS